MQREAEEAEHIQCKDIDQVNHRLKTQKNPKTRRKCPKLNNADSVGKQKNGEQTHLNTQGKAREEDTGGANQGGAGKRTQVEHVSINTG